MLSKALFLFLNIFLVQWKEFLVLSKIHKLYKIIVQDVYDTLLPWSHPCYLDKWCVDVNSVKWSTYNAICWVNVPIPARTSFAGLKTNNTCCHVVITFKLIAFFVLQINKKRIFVFHSSDLFFPWFPCFYGTDCSDLDQQWWSMIGPKQLLFVQLRQTDYNMSNG